MCRKALPVSSRTTEKHIVNYCKSHPIVALLFPRQAEVQDGLLASRNVPEIMGIIYRTGLDVNIVKQTARYDRAQPVNTSCLDCASLTCTETNRQARVAIVG